MNNQPISRFTLANENRRFQTIIYSGDIRCPWKSVYGFPQIAGRLAAGQTLILHCREDEIFVPYRPGFCNQSNITDLVDLPDCSK